jgi:DNA repair protein RadC
MARNRAGRNGGADPQPEPLDAVGGLEEPAPHFLGHRERLRERFRHAGGEALPDYELLELVLFRAVTRADVKPLAKALIDRFGSFGEVIAAPPGRLREVKGVGEAVITELKLIGAAVERVTRGKVRERPVLSSWSAVIAHCRAAMAFAEQEQFRML